MKHTRIIPYFSLLLVLVFVLASCTGNKVEQATTVVTDFVNSYFKTDYDKAATLCSDDLKKEIIESKEIFMSQPDGVRKELRNISEKVIPTITHVNSENRDSIIFTIALEIPDSTDTLPDTTLATVAKDGDQWKVVSVSALH